MRMTDSTGHIINRAVSKPWHILGIGYCCNRPPIIKHEKLEAPYSPKPSMREKKIFITPEVSSCLRSLGFLSLTGPWPLPWPLPSLRLKKAGKRTCVSPD